jgi:hypothetical protein
MKGSMEESNINSVDYFALIVVLMALGYALTILMPVFASTHSLFIAILAIVGGVYMYLDNASRFIRTLRYTSLYIEIAVAIFIIAGLAFHHRYDTLISKAGSGGLFACIYSLITAKDKG